MVDNIPGGLNFSLQENAFIRSNQRKSSASFKSDVQGYPYKFQERKNSYGIYNNQTGNYER